MNENRLKFTVPALVFIAYFLLFLLNFSFFFPFLPYSFICLSTSFIISNTSSPNTFDNPKSIIFNGLSSAVVKNKKFSGFKSLKIVLF